MKQPAANTWNPAQAQAQFQQPVAANSWNPTVGAQFQSPIQPASQFAAPHAAQTTAQPATAAASAAAAMDPFGQTHFAAMPPVPPAGQIFTAPRQPAASTAVADIDKTFGDLFGGPVVKPAAAPSPAVPPPVPPIASVPAPAATTGQHVIFTAQPSAAGTNNNDDFDAFLNSLGSK